jgi:hypothetical protein
MSPAPIAWTRSAPAALLFRVLARLDLRGDAADLHDPALPPAAWTAALADAYAAAPGRLALHWLALDVPDLAALQARLADPPAALADAPGRRLAALVAAALADETAYLDVWAADAAATARAAACDRALRAPLQALRAALWERRGAPPPLQVVDVPALGRRGRGLPGPALHRVAVDLRQPHAHLLCQIFHEEVHVRSDPAVLAGAPPVPRDTRAGAPGFAVHAALEAAAVAVGEAVIAARLPDWLPAYRAWSAGFEPMHG